MESKMRNSELIKIIENKVRTRFALKGDEYVSVSVLHDQNVWSTSIEFGLAGQHPNRFLSEGVDSVVECIGPTLYESLLELKTVVSDLTFKMLIKELPTTVAPTKDTANTSSLLESLAEAVSYTFKDDAVKPGIVSSKIKDGFYASIVRYGSLYPKGKLVVCKTVQSSLDAAYRELTHSFLKDHAKKTINPIDKLKAFLND
jgi:hypothetical protein